MKANTIAAWLVAEIKAAGELAALGGRVFPDFAPEGCDNPCLCYQVAGSDEERTVDEGACGNGSVEFQVRIYAASRAEANDLREKLRARFDGRAPVDLDGARVSGTEVGDFVDTWQEPDHGALATVRVHVEC